MKHFLLFTLCVSGIMYGMETAPSKDDLTFEYVRLNATANALLAVEKTKDHCPRCGKKGKADLRYDQEEAYVCPSCDKAFYRDHRKQKATAIKQFVAAQNSLLKKLR